MGTETRNKGTIFCTKEQFDTLMSTGSVTIDGTTYTYEDGFIYAVVDKDYVDLTSDQDVQGTKVFGRGNDDTAVVKIGPNDNSQTLISVEGQGPQAGNSVALNPDGIEFTQGGGATQYLTMPSAGGTIARTEDVKKYYLHTVVANTDTSGGLPAFVIAKGFYISSRPTALLQSEFVALSASEKVELLSRISGEFVSPTNNRSIIYGPQYRKTQDEIIVFGILNAAGVVSGFEYTIASTDNLSWDEITYPVKEL